MNDCAIGTLTYNYAVLLQNGRECADKLFCKLSWAQFAKPVIDSYIPVGTLISSEGEDACGLTNTEVYFAPFNEDQVTTYAIPSFIYNGNPTAIIGSFSSVLEAMNAVISTLTTLSGVQWSYTQISEWEFLLCAPYTQNGDTVVFDITVTQEAQIGVLQMDVTLSGGVAPETPEYQTEAMNCITLEQYNDMVQTFTNMTDNVSCCDIVKPTTTSDCETNSGDENIELREIGDNELREGGN